MTLGRSGQQISSSCFKGVNGAVHDVVLHSKLEKLSPLAFFTLQDGGSHLYSVAEGT
jgi:hypothetical protein